MPTQQVSEEKPKLISREIDDATKTITPGKDNNDHVLVGREGEMDAIPNIGIGIDLKREGEPEGELTEMAEQNKTDLLLVKQASDPSPYSNEITTEAAADVKKPRITVWSRILRWVLCNRRGNLIKTIV